MSMCNVLGVLGDREDDIWETLRVAVELADCENARLTLVKTCDEGRAYVWVAPQACGGMYVPPAMESPGAAARLLAQVAQHVPDTMPVTTFVLGGETKYELLKLLRTGNYDAVVAEQGLLSRCRRLRRELQRDGIRVVPVVRQPEEGRKPSLASGSQVPSALASRLRLGSAR